MKIILQPEAKIISNRELVENQKYLMNLINKVGNFSFRLPKKAVRPHGRVNAQRGIRIRAVFLKTLGPR